MKRRRDVRVQEARDQRDHTCEQHGQPQHLALVECEYAEDEESAEEEKAVTRPVSSPTGAGERPRAQNR